MHHGHYLHRWLYREVLSGWSTTRTKYYCLNGQRLVVRVGNGSPLDYLVSDPLGSNSIALNNWSRALASDHPIEELVGNISGHVSLTSSSIITYSEQYLPHVNTILH